MNLPAEVAEAIAQMVEFCREQVASASSAEAFEVVRAEYGAYLRAVSSWERKFLLLAL